MKLTRDEIFVILTWVPTAVSYLLGDTNTLIVLLGGNILGLMIYQHKNRIRSNQKLMQFLKKIF